ncbi:MAG: helix-turn-helix transcriptional regulator [Planctomycetota bacterium]
MGKQRRPKPQHSPTYIVLRMKLKELRTDAGLTQKSLGQRFGRPHTFVHKVESGDRRIDPVEFFYWCDFCGQSPTEIVKQIWGK